MMVPSSLLASVYVRDQARELIQYNNKEIRKLKVLMILGQRNALFAVSLSILVQVKLEGRA